MQQEQAFSHKFAKTVQGLTLTDARRKRAREVDMQDYQDALLEQDGM